MKRLGVYDSRQLQSYWYVFRWRLLHNGMPAPNQSRTNMAVNVIYADLDFGDRTGWCNHGALFAQSPNLHNFRLSEFLRERMG